MMTTRQTLLTTLTTVLCVSATASAKPASPEAQPTAEVAKKDTAKKPGKRRHVRMSLEIAGILAIGNRWYWRDEGRPNIEDWQLSHDWRAAETKLSTTGGWRFDGNPFDINALGHPGFGTLTHVLARRNGYSVLESFLINTAVSGTWEVFLELAEYGSINDIITTSPVGIPIGEAAYQILEHRRDTQFKLRTGFGSENGRTFGQLSASGDLDRVPTSGTGTLAGGRRVGFDLSVSSDSDGLRDLSGNAYATLLNHYRHKDGRSLYAGLTTEFTYRNDKDRASRPWHMEARAEAGPSVDLHLRRGATTISIGAKARAGFAMLKSQAFDDWRTMNADAAVRNVMHDKARPYYYALNASVTPWLNIARGNVHAGASASGSVFASIDGHDRDQESLTSDAHMSDSESSAQAWVGYRTGRTTGTLEARSSTRSGSMGDSHAATTNRAAMLQVAYDM